MTFPACPIAGIWMKTSYPSISMSFPSRPVSGPSSPAVGQEISMSFPLVRATGIAGKMIGQRWLKGEEDSVATGHRCVEIRNAGSAKARGISSGRRWTIA
jgi:hypothetical protein